MPILIIDDDEVDRYILKRQLKEAELNFKVSEKFNGKDALDYFKTHFKNQSPLSKEFPPVVIFLDINMPLIDGFEFLKKYGDLRNQFDGQKSYIIVFSSSDREEDKVKALSFDGVKGFLVKGTYSTEDLKTQITDLFGVDIH